MTEGSSCRVVLLGSDGPGTRIIYHALAREFGSVDVVIERRLPKIQIFLRRVRTLGIVTAVGQVPFRAVVVPLLALAGTRRIAQIKCEFNLDVSPIPREVVRVPTVNSPEARAALVKLNPTVVAVSGTRIISRATLASVTAPFINMHGGITPLYRGVHGGYWALVEGRPDLVGSTVHRVDEGIDTGEIIAQAIFTATADDSFATLPYLHTAVGTPILVAAVRSACAGTLGGGQFTKLPTRLRTHPTVWAYLWTWFRKGVK